MRGRSCYNTYGWKKCLVLDVRKKNPDVPCVCVCVCEGKTRQSVFVNGNRETFAARRSEDCEREEVLGDRLRIALQKFT
jgi:hypothetical protein